MLCPQLRLRCRQIDGSDVDALATLLSRGFPRYNRQFWIQAFAQLTRHEPPPGFPRYGYLMESDGVPVGTILLICSTMRVVDSVVPRCNFSSWYVEPKYRRYGSLLLSEALRHQNATYLNISPSRHTWAKIEAQGFSRFCDGIFVAVWRSISSWSDGSKYTCGWRSAHFAYGCLSLWCVTSEGAY